MRGSLGTCWSTLHMHIATLCLQAYGKQRMSSDLRDRWCARGIELLLAHHHSALRVAMLDGGAQGRQVHSYSVLLLKARPVGAAPPGVPVAPPPHQAPTSPIYSPAPVSASSDLALHLTPGWPSSAKGEALASGPPSAKVAALVADTKGGYQHGPVLPGGTDGTAPVVIEEAYRVRLPINPHSGRGIIIGEGKPETQVSEGGSEGVSEEGPLAVTLWYQWAHQELNQVGWSQGTELRTCSSPWLLPPGCRTTR
jgi:hypothetical protein